MIIIMQGTRGKGESGHGQGLEFEEMVDLRLTLES